jgi:hypothetical protein
VLAQSVFYPPGGAGVGDLPTRREEVDAKHATSPPHIIYASLKASEEPVPPFKRLMLKEHGTLHVVDLPDPPLD